MKMKERNNKMERLEKITVVLYAIMIGLGFYSLVNWFSNGITPTRVMSIVGLAVVATFVELRYSYNRGVRFILEIGRDVLGGLGSLSVINLLPITISEELSVVIMLAATAILAITVPDVFVDGEDEVEEQ